MRQNVGNWLLGGNAFYDYDFTRGHRRLGLGTEAWTDYLKFSGNYYHPLSDWKDSEDFDFYEERPARGWDIRMESWLPFYPQLGAKLVYEQYYGDEVALFGTDNLQKILMPSLWGWNIRRYRWSRLVRITKPVLAIVTILALTRP